MANLKFFSSFVWQSFKLNRTYSVMLAAHCRREAPADRSRPLPPLEYFLGFDSHKEDSNSASAARHIPFVASSGFCKKDAIPSPIVTKAGSLYCNRVAIIATTLTVFAAMTVINRRISYCRTQRGYDSAKHQEIG